MHEFAEGLVWIYAEQERRIGLFAAPQFTRELERYDQLITWLRATGWSDIEVWNGMVHSGGDGVMMVRRPMRTVLGRSLDQVGAEEIAAMAAAELVPADG